MGAAEAARKISPKELDDLTALPAEFISLTSTNPTRASYLNRKFHFSILEASSMPTPIRTVETFWVITLPLLQIFPVKPRQAKRRLGKEVVDTCKIWWSRAL